MDVPLYAVLGGYGIGRRAIRVRLELRQSQRSESIAGTVPVVSQAASAAIVLAGAAWLAGVASGCLAHALHVELSACSAALGAAELLERIGFWGIVRRP